MVLNFFNLVLKRYWKSMEKLFENAWEPCSLVSKTSHQHHFTRYMTHRTWAFILSLNRFINSNFCRAPNYVTQQLSRLIVSNYATFGDIAPCACANEPIAISLLRTWYPLCKSFKVAKCSWSWQTQRTNSASTQAVQQFKFLCGQMTKQNCRQSWWHVCSDR